MPELIANTLNSTRLLFDLQRANEIAQQFSGCLNPEAIARYTTDGLVERFNGAFARIWLLEPDKTSLRLVASSGLYTRLDGSFARVPMGAYKVGKIAQNRVSFLSNNLAEESWVKNREWAIANRIRGFAGFPLIAADRVIGVLAVFSHDALSPEFLEVLQILCTMVSIAINTAVRYQQEQLVQPSVVPNLGLKQATLSDQLATILGSTRLTLIGTERSLALSQNYLFLQVAEVLNTLNCRYGRLLYQEEGVALEAIVAAPSKESGNDWLASHFGILIGLASWLGGELKGEAIANQNVVQILLQLPYVSVKHERSLQIRCRFPILQLAFTQLAHAAGFDVSHQGQKNIPIITDDVAVLNQGYQVVWIRQGNEPIPGRVSASIDLSITPEQLRNVVAQLERGDLPTIHSTDDESALLSAREQEILRLLTQGLRDRDIANQLIISESTVKFHINNALSKLKARTRFQAIYQVMRKGWL